MKYSSIRHKILSVLLSIALLSSYTLYKPQLAYANPAVISAISWLGSYLVSLGATGLVIADQQGAFGYSGDLWDSSVDLWNTLTSTEQQELVNKVTDTALVYGVMPANYVYGLSEKVYNWIFSSTSHSIPILSPVNYSKVFLNNRINFTNVYGGTCNIILPVGQTSSILIEYEASYTKSGNFITITSYDPQTLNHSSYWEQYLNEPWKRDLVLSSFNQVIEDLLLGKSTEMQYINTEYYRVVMSDTYFPGIFVGNPTAVPSDWNYSTTGYYFSSSIYDDFTTGEKTVVNDRPKEAPVVIPLHPVDLTGKTFEDSIPNAVDGTDIGIRPTDAQLEALQTLTGTPDYVMTDTYTGTIADTFISAMDLNFFTSTMTALQTFDTTTPPAPKIEFDLNALVTATNRFHNKSGVFPNESYVLFDFAILEEYSYQGKTLDEFIRFITGMGFIISTLFYIYRKIIPDKAVG